MAIQSCLEHRGGYSRVGYQDPQERHHKDNENLGKTICAYVWNTRPRGSPSSKVIMGAERMEPLAVFSSAGRSGETQLWASYTL